MIHDSLARDHQINLELMLGLLLKGLKYLLRNHVTPYPSISQHRLWSVLLNLEVTSL